MSDEPTLSFEGRGLKLDTAEDAEIICRELATRQFTKLVLAGNTFGIEAAKRLGQELARQVFLREAHFKDIFTGRNKSEVPVAIDYLLTGVTKSCTQLTLLDLSDNAIGPTGAPSIGKFLGSPAASKITKLYLNNCGIGPEGSTIIAGPISELKLKELVCGRNRLEDKGAWFITGALREMDTLEVLKMPQNGIYIEGITAIVIGLMKNIKTIRIIDLSDNILKPSGAEALEKVILRANNLQELRLDDVLLGNRGFSIICDAISKSKLAKNSLLEASFEGNELKGTKIIDLIDLTFSECQGDFTLNLLDNQFTRDELIALSKLTDRFNLITDDPEDMDDSEDEDDDDEEDSEDEEESDS